MLTTTEKCMIHLKLLGAAAVLSSALASPTMAQQVVTNPGYCAQFYPNANCQNKGPDSPYTGDYQRRLAYENGPYKYGKGDWTESYNDNRWNNDSGFWPGDVAVGVVGGAIGTAGAVATAPFRGSSYAYYDGRSWRPSEYSPNSGYGARNGFVCQPGTWFKGDDGRRHLCQ
jgi:hypothetical protein